MPTKIFSPVLSGYARKADLVYPPQGNVFTQGVLGKPERSYEAALTQYRIGVVIVKFSISGIRPGANSFVYTLNLTVVRNNANARQLRIDNYGAGVPFWSGVNGADYQELQLTGDAAAINIASLIDGANSIPLSGIPDTPSGNVLLRLGISGTSPTGLNDLSISAITLTAKFSYSTTPTGLNIDGDANNGISVPRANIHRFGWSTGQASTRFVLQYKRETSPTWTTVDSIVSDQFWDAPANTFTSSTDNNWRWRVQAYDVENTLSALSVENTFIGVTTLAAPAVSPTGSISTALPTITMSGMATHTRERFQILEGSVLIYDTVPLVQTSGVHTLIAASFRNGKTGLENGHAYTLKPQIIASDGAIGIGSSSIAVVFTPPTQPTIQLTEGTGFIEAGYTNPAGGLAVTSNDVYYSTDYDPQTQLGTWVLLATGLGNSQTAPDPTVQLYEARSGQIYWFKVRAWAGVAFIDSIPVNITMYLDGWLWLHAIASPSTTLIRLRGWTFDGGSESGYTVAWQPNKTIRGFLNSAEPSSDSEITEDGEQVGVTNVHVAIMNIEATGMDAAGFTAALVTLMKMPGQLCIRGAERPLGLMAYGEITSAALPTRPNTVGGELVSGFEFTSTKR